MLNVHCSSSQDASDKVGRIMMIQVWVFIDYPGMAKKKNTILEVSIQGGPLPVIIAVKWPFE